MSIVADIAQSVTDLLNNNQTEIGTQFTATRCYLPNYDAAKTPGLKVYVMGLGQSFDLKAGTRESTFDTYTINVFIYNQIGYDNGQPSTTEIDAMMDFVEKVIGVIKANKIVSDYAAWTKVTNNPACLIDNKNTFGSALSIEYQCFAD
jgi:hypothetical protein